MTAPLRTRRLRTFSGLEIPDDVKLVRDKTGRLYSRGWHSGWWPLRKDGTRMPMFVTTFELLRSGKVWEVQS